MINPKTISDKQIIKATLPDSEDKNFWTNLKNMADEENSFNKFLFELK